MQGSSLAGRRVVEMGSYVATPFAGHLLQSLGADVIKIESFDGDPTRRLYRGGPGGTFIAYSHGKRSICVDLTHPNGQKVFDRLLCTADILLHNLAPESARRLKVSAERCHLVNPELVFCQVTGYGPGPRQHLKATNPLIEAATGVMFQHRVQGRPTRLGPSYLDMFAGYNAVIAILSSLLDRERRQPRTIEVPLYETGLHVAARDLVAGQLESRAVTRGLPPVKSAEFGHPGYAAYETSDRRWIYLLMLTDAHWRSFCTCMNIPWDDSLADLEARKAHFEQVDALVASTIATRRYDDIDDALSGRFAFSEVRLPAAVLEDPQARQADKCAHVSAHAQILDVPLFPVSFASGEGRDAAQAPGQLPELGEHTRDLLSSLGYTRGECDELESEGAIRAN